MVPRALAWAGGILAFGVADLYAVGGTLDHTDLLLVGLGMAPVAAFALLVMRSRDPMDN